MSVSVTYKGNVIAEMNESGTKTLNTSGMYCEGDIKVEYAASSVPGDNDSIRSKTYEITLAKASGWVLLTTLDADVLAHINDESLVVSLTNISEYTHEASYTRSMILATNVSLAKQGSYPVYGVGIQNNSATAVSGQPVFHKASDTDTSDLGGIGRFRVNGGKYYVKPGDSFVRSGTYLLTFTW